MANKPILSTSPERMKVLAHRSHQGYTVYNADTMIENGWLPLDILDARGKSIPRRITEFCIETGEVVFDVYENGNPVITSDGSQVFQKMERFKAPLSYIPNISKEHLARIIAETLEAEKHGKE